MQELSAQQLRTWVDRQNDRPVLIEADEHGETRIDTAGDPEQAAQRLTRLAATALAVAQELRGVARRGPWTAPPGEVPWWLYAEPVVHPSW